MFVVTADQVGSRSGEDLADAALAMLERSMPLGPLPPDRTAGDEVQAATPDAGEALDAVLVLTRTGRWSVGLGVGGLRSPLPDAVRKATGGAFIAAREAVEAAKREPTRFALRAAPAADHPEDDGSVPAGTRAAAPSAADAESLVALLVALRGHRTEAGWEVADLTADGTTQRAVAEELGVTAAAISARARAAHLALERAAVPALVRLLGALPGARDAAEGIGAHER